MRTVLHNNSATNHWRPCKRGLHISLLNVHFGPFYVTVHWTTELLGFLFIYTKSRTVRLYIVLSIDASLCILGVGGLCHVEVRLPKFGQTVALILLVAKKELRESIENCTATAIAELAQKGIE